MKNVLNFGLMYLKTLYLKTLCLGTLYLATFCLVTALQCGCAIDWSTELAQTHWRGLNSPGVSGGFGGPVEEPRHSKFASVGMTLYQNRIVTITRLNESGMAVMELQGCLGCHEDGGQLPSLAVAAKFTLPETMVVDGGDKFTRPGGAIIPVTTLAGLP